MKFWYSNIYKNIEIKLDNMSYQVKYMNDKYIIYWTWEILSNNEDIKFIINWTEGLNK